MQVEVEGDGPHDDEPRVQVLDLPRHSPARSRRRAALQTNQSAQFAMSSSIIATLYKIPKGETAI